MTSLYFRQVKIGPMKDFMYLVGDTEARECMVIDPAWSVDGLQKQDADEMKLTGALITHYHPDHRGSMLGFTVGGLPQLMEKRPVPVHVNSHEATDYFRSQASQSRTLYATIQVITYTSGRFRLLFIHSTSRQSMFPVG